MNARTLDMALRTLIAGCIICLLLILIAVTSHHGRSEKSLRMEAQKAERIRLAKEEFARRVAADRQLQLEANHMIFPLAQVPVKERP